MSESEPLTSYQMRKNEIAYLRQRGIDLEAYVFALCEQLVDHGIEPAWPLLPGCVGDAVLTDVNSGLFDFDIVNHVAAYKQGKKHDLPRT